MKRILFLAMVGLLLAGFVLNGCSASTPSVTATKELKIGSIVALKIPVGLEIKKWHDLFAKMINDQGGLKVGNTVYQIQMTAYDGNNMDPNATSTAAQKAISQDGCTILLDDWADVAELTASIADPAHVLVLGMGSTNAAVQPTVNYYVRSSGVHFGRGLNYFVYQDYHKKGANTGLVCAGDSLEGHTQATEYAATMQAAGIKVLSPVFYDITTVDFTAFATKIKSENPDMVDITGATNFPALVSALKDSGWKGMIAPGGISGRDTGNVVKMVGNYFDGAETAMFDPRAIKQDADMQALIDEYTKEYGTFSTDGCYWVAGWFMLKDAINATKSVDPTVLKNYLQKGPPAVKTLVGYSQLFARPDLQNFRTIDAAGGHGIGIVQNGNLVYYGQVAAQDQYLASIVSYSQVDVYQKYWDQYGKPKFASEPALFTFADLTK
jgi:branched-chain amino acid transport system substrate-binding protein